MAWKAAFLLLALPAIASAAPRKAADQAEKASDDPDKVICKTFTETGSLIATKRKCRTKRDWERMRGSMSAPLATSCNTANTGMCR